MEHPKTLNGYPVRAYAPRGNSGDALRVLVERPGNFVDPWVLASWHPSMGEAEWAMGYYFTTRDRAVGYASLEFGVDAWEVVQ